MPYTYECRFDFTTVKKSKFTGKNGVIELTTDMPFSQEEMNALKTDQEFLISLADNISNAHKIKNIFTVTVTAITFKQFIV